MSYDSKRYKLIGGVADGETYIFETYRDMVYVPKRLELSMYDPTATVPPDLMTTEFSIYTKRKLRFSSESWDVMEFYAERSLTDREAILLQFGK